MPIAAFLLAAMIALCVPSLAQQPDAAAGDAASGSVAAPPDPRALSARWWDYFVSDGQLRDDAAEPARALLRDLASKSQDPRVAQAQNRFETQLQALAELSKAAAPLADPAPVLQPNYTLGELIAVSNQRLDLSHDVVLERANTERLETAVRDARKDYDNKFAAYLALADDAQERLLRGTGLMAERAALALARARAERARRTLTLREATLTELQSIATAARTRLQANAETSAQLEEQIRQQRAALADAEERQRTLEDQAIPVPDATALGNERARLANLRIIEAGVTSARERTALQLLLARRDWNSLRLNGDEMALDDIIAQCAVRNQYVENVSANQSDWRNVTQRDLLDSGNLSGDDETLKTTTRERLETAQSTLLALDRLRRGNAELRLVNELVDAEVAGSQNLLERGFTSGYSGLKQTYAKASEWLTASLFRIGDTPVTSLGLLRLVFIVLISLWISRLFRGALQRVANRSGGNRDLAAYYTVGRLAHYAIIVIGLMIGLASIGLNFSSLALVAGALSVGIGFGLQSIVNNFVSGLIILFERSLKVGDFIELDSGLAGTVREINVRSTLINTNDNIDIVVPNSEFVSSRLTNWTLRDVDRRVRIPFGVAYGTDKEKVRDAVLKAADRVPFTLNVPKSKAPQVWLVEFGDSSLNFELVVWLNPDAVRRPSAVHAKYTWEIETALGEAGIEIPFPQRDLHLRSGFEPLAPREARGGDE